MARHGFHERMHERHVDHGGFVDHEKIGIERVVLILPKSPRLRIDLQKPMDGFGLLPGRLAHALRGASRGRAEQHVHLLRLQNAQDRVHNRRLADTWTARDDENLGLKCQLDRLLLAVGEEES